MKWTILRRVFGGLGVALLISYAAGVGLTGSVILDVSATQAQSGGNVPGKVRGTFNPTDMWSAVNKGGIRGTVSIPDKQAGQLIQRNGDQWRSNRTKYIYTFGGYLLLGVFISLAIFFALRGRIQIDAGPSGKTIERFNALERFTHWLTASSFLVLGLTGLNLLYGKTVLLPIIGKSAFANLAMLGKLTHNYISFAFMLGITLMLVLWIKDNLPDRHDLNWLAKGGGLFVKGVHPPAKKFNAGQKFIFWVVVLGGGSISLTGITLLWPFQFELFSSTFAFLNIFGAGLDTNLSPLQEVQLSQMWHNVMAMLVLALMIAHIYIGSLGMAGAFDAVGTGQVDENWAKEHHSLWVEETKARDAPAE
ncbi:MAG: formate dehydrogenase subunit gamma [Rhodospirillaceae bacterium]|jgi:formate dehydrogenase subunit gamma|nr:formate dehydrogenase subunit gamma [Rhodospirillales bacterium]MBT3905401.1 formate dehydrogenase subunit gamma [Rhodospirillaceae bacterium]MBT4701776.1 formate dehydrogenase subunit gamma [Rhodospirillaceae bacterium]MBT5034132.1 formate dehydrogenase subunit gamma [Rhodospirillaceae bacterium]MBT6218594.1 formate dehydrogenase subunit gamma [Rhodospirillaceae bacterium]